MMIRKLSTISADRAEQAPPTPHPESAALVMTWGWISVISYILGLLLVSFGPANEPKHGPIDPCTPIIRDYAKSDLATWHRIIGG